MHDVTAAQGIARTVLEAAAERKAHRVECISIALGAMTMIDPDQLEFWLGQILRGTHAEGAEIEIEQRPLMVRCKECGWEGEAEVPEDPIYHLMPFAPSCPRCQSKSLAVLGGDECTVQSIRVRRAEAGAETDG